jgi:4-hydroxy-tetrahydrodipicolinate synthase
MFSGSLVAIVTPQRADGSVDYVAWDRLLDFHLASGTKGVVVGGSTGESASLSDAELCDLTRKACDRVENRMYVIAGAATNCTATTVERVRMLCALPISGLMTVTPSYVKPTQEGLYRHYAAVGEAATVPVIVYNVPSRTAVDLLPATMARLAQLPRLRAIKEAVADMARVRELVSLCGSDFDVLTGDDPTACQAVLAGAKGVISVTANVAPRGVADMIAAAIRGDVAEATRLDGGLAPLHRALFVETNPIPVKWALKEMGLIGPALRLPLTELSKEHHEPLRRVLRTAGVLNG